MLSEKSVHNINRSIGPAQCCMCAYVLCVCVHACIDKIECMLFIKKLKKVLLRMEVGDRTLEKKKQTTKSPCRDC